MTDAVRQEPCRVVIAGAGGRDFHNFNVVYRDNDQARVVAFTATQIPGIDDRRYPPALAGSLYPDGIPIVDESKLEELVRREHVDQVVFAYSDVSHAEVMHVASRAQHAGADFVLLGPKRTMLESRLPVIAVCAVRTGCGKSQTARWICERLTGHRVRAAVIRHPMPYGNLDAQTVQRFETVADLESAACTAEEREEYEPYIESGHVIFAGVDYRRTLDRAEREADVIIWDGGNNDFPFIKPNLLIAVADALRPTHVATHHPGETVARMADVLVVNKIEAASSADVQTLVDELTAVNPSADLCRAASPVTLDEPERVAGQRVLVVEDGPTITHGGMPYGAGYVAAIGAHAHTIVDPREWAAPVIRDVYERHPHIGRVLPAMGYGEHQLADLRQTINDSDAEIVVSGTPCDLASMIVITKPVVRARYRFSERGEPKLGGVIDAFVLHHLPG